MTKTLTIAWKEYRGFFTGATAYVAGGLLVLIISFMYLQIVFHYAGQVMVMAQLQGRGAPSLTEFLLPPHFGNINVLLLLFVPPIMMRLMSDEYRNRTMDLLMTSPITATHIVVGKFLAGLFFVWTTLAITALNLVVTNFFGKIDFGPALGGYLGLMLISGVYVGTCLFASSLTENPVIAAVLGFVLCLFLWVISWASGNFDNQILQNLFKNLSVTTHFMDFAKGVLNTQAVVYYLSLTFFFCFLSHRVVESARWR